MSRDNIQSVLDIEARDERAISSLVAIDEAIHDTLRVLPNHRESVFEGRDVEDLVRAKRIISVIIAGAYETRRAMRSAS